MKPIPSVLLPHFLEALNGASVSDDELADYQKWLRYYLDFCFKYRHPPRDRESLDEFLQKLASKNQSRALQEQAARSIAIYYDVVKDWPLGKGPGNLAEAPEDAWSDVYRKLKEEIRIRQYSRKTHATYRTWVEQFQHFLKDKPPEQITDDDAKDYLTHLAVNRKVVATTQNQAFNALLFLFRHILKSEYDLRDKVVRARRTRYVPVVLTREEVDRVINGLVIPHRLIAGMLYGCGLRLFECLNLRVGDLNFEDGIVTVHDGKGKKDRTLVMPQALVPDLRLQLERDRKLHEQDLAADYRGVFLPGALDRKWKSAAREWVWQWLFPARSLTYVPDENAHRRYHVHESVFQKALRAAVMKARIPKRVTAHTFRHSFASHLLRNNYDIRTIQEMLGHSDVKTTMIYTHTVQSRTQKERKSPLDF